MISLTEHLILELNSSTLKSAYQKAKKRNDERTEKFKQAYLDKLSEEVEAKKEELRSYAEEDKEIFDRIKEGVGMRLYNIDKPRSISKKNNFAIVGNNYRTRIQHKSGIYDSWDFEVVPYWMALEKYNKDGFSQAFFRENGKRIIPMYIEEYEYIGEKNGRAGNNFMNIVYDIDADKIYATKGNESSKYVKYKIADKEMMHFTSGEKGMFQRYDNIDEFFKLVEADSENLRGPKPREYFNYFLKQINPKHKNI